MPVALGQDAMQVFLSHITSYPTVIFTALVMFVMLYWLVSLLGLVDMDDGSDMVSDTAMLSGLLMKFGLQGVPILLILTIFSLTGWLLSYLAMRLFTQLFTQLLAQPSMAAWQPQGVLFYACASLVLLVVIWLSLIATGWLIKPFRRMIDSVPQHNAASLVGKIATVRTLSVDEQHGEALLEDGGAGLILKVRSSHGNFVQGDKVLLVKYQPETNAYLIKPMVD